MEKCGLTCQPDSETPAVILGRNSWFRRTAPLLTAVVLWSGFVAYCLATNFRQGLCCADDGWFAINAKCLATGQGYGTTFLGFSTFGRHDDGQGIVLFNPYTGTGPALIVPSAAITSLFGFNDVVPGISSIFVWSTVLTMLLWLLSRDCPGWRSSLGIGCYVVTILTFFARCFGQWHALLGEIPAAAYLSMGHWLLAMGSGSVSLYLSGVFLGLAVQTKLLTLLGCAGTVVILAIRLIGEQRGLRASCAQIAIWMAGGAAPTLVFESYKLDVLGSQRWLQNWSEFLIALKEFTVDRPPALTVAIVAKRCGQIHDTFQLNLLGLLVLLAVAIVLLIRNSVDWRWRSLFVGLLMSAACGGVYWACCSVGWPRYLTSSIALLCFALTIPVCAMSDWKAISCYVACLLILLSPGITGFVSRKWLPVVPSEERVARARVAEIIEDLRGQGPVVLSSRLWTEFADVEFLLAPGVRFRELMTEGPPPRANPSSMSRQIGLINRRFGAAFRAERSVDEAADLERLMRRPIKAVLFEGSSFQLLEFGDPTAAAAAKADGTPAPRAAAASDARE